MRKAERHEPNTELMAAREAAGFTQAEVHEKLQIPIATLSQWERGRTKPAPYIITLLKEWYGRNGK